MKLLVMSITGCKRFLTPAKTFRVKMKDGRDHVNPIFAARCLSLVG